MVEVKICGLRRREDIEYANALLPDYIGFVFAQSRRRVLPKEAADLRERLDARVKAVGVFVDAPPRVVAETAALCRLDAVQLHGAEDAAYVAELRRLIPPSLTVIKAARVRGSGDIRSAIAAKPDRLLLDAYSPEANGGTGQSFDWGLMGSDIDRPFFVAGGITPENVAEVIAAAGRANRPFAVDVSGGVETDGYKDFRKMKRLIAAARAAL